MVRLRFILPLGMLLAVAALVVPASASPGTVDVSVKPSGKLTVFLLEGLEFKDLLSADYPALNRIAVEGACGLMTTRTSGALAAEKLILTMSAGVLSTAGTEAGLVCGVNEFYQGQPVRDVFRTRTGKTPPENGVVALEIASVWRRIAASDTTGRPGSLGAALRRNGLLTAAIGNSDPADLPRRLGALLAMDDIGQVDLGMVGTDLLVADPSFPSGRRLDGSKVLAAHQELRASADFLVVEFGDLARVELEQQRLMDSVLQRYRATALQRADRVLAQIMADMDSQRDLLLLVSAAPSVSAINQGDRLMPVAAYGHGMSSGLLSSKSTRTKGLVIPEDLAPTIWGFFGIEPAGSVSGSPFQAVKGSTPSLTRTHQRWIQTELIRRTFLEGYVLLLIAGIVWAALLILIWPGTVRMARITGGCLIALALTPLVFLLLPLFPVNSHLVLAVLGFSMASTGAAAILRYCRRPSMALALVSWLTVTAIAGDLLTGRYLLGRSMLSYSPMVGARFYGLGNEYMGVFIGAAIMAAGTALSLVRGRASWPRWLISVFFVLVAGMTALPRLGANVGGALTAGVAFSVTYWLFTGRKLRPRHFLLAVLAGGAFLLTLGFMELARGPEKMTHLGRALSGILNDGPTGFLVLIQRKIAMNLRLFRYTYWTRVLLAFLFTLPILFKRPPDVLARVFRTHPMLYRAFCGTVLASLVTLVVNDSGVVASATCMIVAGISLLYLVLNEVYPGVGTENGYCRRRDDVGRGEDHSRP